MLEDQLQQRQGGDITYRDMVEPAAPESPVRDFYERSVILVTGATGFMGKVLIEKLLRSCPKLPKLYILARPKKGKDIAERFKEQFADALYDRLRREQPDFMTKLFFVSGDVSSINLGLSDEDMVKITQDVNVIFHGAATVRFDEPLKYSVLVNVRGTREALLVARKCPNLTAFVHISTAYAHCVNKEIREKFYEPPIKAESLITLVETLDENTVSKITPVLLDKFPNTYAFTKMVAENMVEELAKGFPVAVMRPSIIVSTANEPVQGWIDNVYGPTGVIMGAGLGLLRTLHCNKKILADIIPVDFVINATIVAAYEVSIVHESPNKEELEKLGNGLNQNTEERAVPIYNYVSCNDRPITWGYFMQLSEESGIKIPSTMCLWYYCFTLNRHKTVHLMYMYLLHVLPAYIVDFILFCIGKKPMLVKAYAKIHKFSSVISYFSTQQWKFHNTNVKQLLNVLTPGDRALFEFDISKLVWEDFFYTYLRGVRLYLIKDTFDTVPEGVKKYKMLRVAHYSIVFVICFCIFRLGWFFFQKFGLL